MPGSESSVSSVAHVFTVRGRPVGFQPARFGGALVAVQRGYFPVSPTGYRSLSGHFGTGPGAPDSIPAEFLESLAVNEDQNRRRLLVQLARVPRAGADALGNYITVSGTASQAVQAAFFAPDDERAQFWGGAFRLLCLIDSDRRFQPASTAPAWTPAACATSLASQRELLGYVRRVASGDLSAKPPGFHIGVSAYFDLPERPEVQAAFALPTITQEFGLDVPTASAWDEDDEEIEPDSVLAAPVDESTDSADQLTLF